MQVDSISFLLHIWKKNAQKEAYNIVGVSYQKLRTKPLGISFSAVPRPCNFQGKL